jgi:hypothetical protein
MLVVDSIDIQRSICHENGQRNWPKLNCPEKLSCVGHVTIGYSDSNELEIFQQTTRVK